MPENFTVFNARNRDVNVQYNSAVYAVPVDTTDTMVRFTITDIDLDNEPDTTIFHWMIERSEGGGWRHMVGGSVHGLNGETSPKPPGRIGTNIDNIRGEQLRGVIWLESASDQRKRFGVSGETY